MGQQRNPVLARLDALVGEWELAAIVGGRTVAGGRTTFEWLAGGAFLVQHAEAGSARPDIPPEWVANSPFPVVTIFGLDDTSERFTMLYADARAVFRVYEMTLADEVWTVWREAPGFNQRFTGTFSADGRTITGRWEGSSDGSSWELDFEQTYTKIG